MRLDTLSCVIPFLWTNNSSFALFSTGLYYILMGLAFTLNYELYMDPPAPNFVIRLCLRILSSPLLSSSHCLSPFLAHRKCSVNTCDINRRKQKKNLVPLKVLELSSVTHFHCIPQRSTHPPFVSLLFLKFIKFFFVSILFSFLIWLY